MKNIVLLLLIVLPLNTIKAQFLTEDRTQFSFWVDPVATDKEGGLYAGIEITKIMHGGWISLSLSDFQKLTPRYTDLVVSGGINFNLFNIDNIRYYTGGRLGFLWREGKGFPLVGSVAGFDVRLTKKDGDTELSIGARYWIDYREDQKNSFYGDSDAFEPGPLGLKNPLLQENGAIVISFTWD